MEEKRLEEQIFVRDVFQDIPEKKEIETHLKGGCPLEYIVAAYSAETAQVMFEAVLIEIESSNFTAISFFDLSLEHAVPATDIRDFSSAGNQTAGQLLKNLKSASHPEMMEGGKMEIAICHADYSRWRQIFDGTGQAGLGGGVCWRHLGGSR